MGYSIRALNGPLDGSVFPVEQRVIIGRGADVDIQLVQAGVSRQHAAVLIDDGGTPHVMDLASKNGTFVDGCSIGREQLTVGDKFIVAETEFILEAAVTSPLTSTDAELQALHLASGPAADATVEAARLSPEELSKLVDAAKRKSD